MVLALTRTKADLLSRYYYTLALKAVNENAEFLVSLEELMFNLTEAIAKKKTPAINSQLLSVCYLLKQKHVESIDHHTQETIVQKSIDSWDCNLIAFRRLKKLQIRERVYAKQTHNKIAITKCSSLLADIFL